MTDDSKDNWISVSSEMVEKAPKIKVKISDAPNK